MYDRGETTRRALSEVKPTGRLAAALGSLGLAAGALLIAASSRWLPPDLPSHPPAEDAGEARPSPHAVIHDMRPGQPARRVADDLIAPPPVDASGIERIEARPPLGELGLASRPKTPMPLDWRATLLYRPVATSSATFEAMGRKIVISGAVDIDPARTCAFGDAVWPCGQRARAAFNAWLRGRALKCVLPPDGDRFTIAAPCMLGKQDVGAWLVANGWAMASPSGIYGKAESVARSAEMGVFGPPQ
ncbi:thermonuclease family protein [Mesorhizobium sp. M1C.F.Ca.ET.193.01.1.1]|nr:MAG: thermonuclease family protein [Mesorhizobium sp.]TGQ55029.1 thermonuclease family protein [Mesorhizobium sp. M1C.F.Ca.ET.210.01.1.1]TGQ73676.1 thermonuclease family protein [Mesorhizobium sp. M1C.F.Ca.ET.212.01.1.1]TGR12517.1 thermonuclease family protein [Mesorhizobium sp. M1C.F.Ca.ET.204.01.1.1]TGR31690.1 thermonuclease family protein [Mesorhizobium sp. M1C.F.Ca.ET.196.01.1.1]TGR54629.1 thermonuclease family protein [Mesorhizobium sp. M1C.F.Ca.ET.195.01.1.1]TGR67603.1 thermonuclease